MTSRNCRKFSLLALGIVSASFLLFWHLLETDINDYDLETNTVGSVDFDLEISDLELGSWSGAGSGSRSALESGSGSRGAADRITSGSDLPNSDLGSVSGGEFASNGPPVDSIPNLATNSEDSTKNMNYFLWSRKPAEVNWAETADLCRAVLQPPSNESDQIFNRTMHLARNWTVPDAHTDHSMLTLLSNCTNFHQLIPFPTEPASPSEAKFPLAYVLVAARNVAQTVRLLRMIYQPQNVYCLTYDNKSSETLKSAIKQVGNCFPENVFLTPQPENIYYTHYSILRSVMICMEVLLNQSDRFPWRYIQIVSWNDFPLRTNSEMVRVFEILNGSQDSALDRNIEGFYVFYHDIRGDIMPRMHKPVTPDGLTMYKGSYATSMSRQFVQFLFKNPTSQKFYKWLNGSKCPEEQYWVTIIHNVHLKAPGAFPGQCLQFYAMRGRQKPFASRYQIWTFSSEKCRGKMTNFSCVYGVRDVAHLITRPELIAHKIYEEFEPAAAFCLEQWYWKRVREGVRVLNESYYENFPSVRYQNMADKDKFVC